MQRNLYHIESDSLSIAALHPSYSLLAEEAAVRVLSNELEEFFNRSRSWMRRITVPLQVGSLPIDLPVLLGLVVGRFRDRMLDQSVSVLPMGSDLAVVLSIARIFARRSSKTFARAMVSSS